ncbi:hypothetical protein FRC11_001404 [Ceratobasidium sp. 423]|nr:hypothetical protein FRC11_001404 [Ceratobasidium sp. 423]
MDPQQRGRSRGRGGPPGGDRGGSAPRGGGDGGRGGDHRGDRGGHGGDRGSRSRSRDRGGPRGQGGFAHRHDAVIAPPYHSDPAEATGVDAPTIAAGGPNSKFRQIRPKDGSWNLRDQKLFKGATCNGWALVVYDTRGVRQSDTQDIVRGLKEQADLLGIQQISNDPVVVFPSAQYQDVAQQLRLAGQQVYQKTKALPSLIVIVLPENSAELYQAIKHFGDVTQGIATQCLKSNKCRGAKPHYWANVCLKINAKLGGVNNILDPNTPNLRFLTDAANPPIVLGADVMHPAPGTKDRPSFASLVGSIDSNVTHYTAVSQAQDSRVEMIHNLEGMVYEVLGRHVHWKSAQEEKQVASPKRLIYYRDGVSEGQFRQVLEIELPAIRGISQGFA